MSTSQEKLEALILRTADFLKERDVLLAALAQIERLSRTADRSQVDVASMLGDIARAAIAKATQE
jgi:hypothetical protein